MYPKQFIRFFDDQASSFLAATLKRLAPDAGFAAPIIVCNNDHRFLVKEEAERAGVTPQAIVLEPVARNTAPAAAVAALLVARARSRGRPGADALRPRRSRTSRVSSPPCGGRPRSQQRAGSCCSASRRPDRTPATATSAAAHRCRASTTPSPSRPSWRSPTGRRRQATLKAGGHFWNSGIFVFRAQTFLDELARLDARSWTPPSGRWPRPGRTWAFCASAMPSPRRPPSPSTTR